MQALLNQNNLTIATLVQQFTDYFEYVKSKDDVQYSQIKALQDTLYGIKEVINNFITQYTTDQQKGEKIGAERHQELIDYLSSLITISNVNGENLDDVISMLKQQGIQLNDIMAALINNGKSINKVIDLAKQNSLGIDEVKKEFNNVYAGQEEILAAINNVLEGVYAGKELSANNEKLLLSLIAAVKKLDQNDAGLKTDLANIMTKLSEAIKAGEAFISEGLAGAVTEISTQISKSDRNNQQRYEKIMEKLNATVDLVTSNITISEKTSKTLDKVYAVITGLNGKFDENLLPLATEILDRINQLASDTKVNHDEEIELLGKILTNHEKSSALIQKGITEILALINSGIEIDKETQKLIEDLFIDLSTLIGLDKTDLTNRIEAVKEAITGIKIDLDVITKLLNDINGKIGILSNDLKASIEKLTELTRNNNEISKENNKLIKLILEHVAKCEAFDYQKMDLLNAILERVNYSIEKNIDLSKNESALIETVLGQTSENNAILKDNQALILKLFDKIGACKDNNNPEIMKMLDRILARFNDVMSQNDANHKSEMKVLESILDNIETMNTDMREGVSKLLGLIESNKNITEENQNLIMKLFNVISSGGYDDTKLMAIVNNLLAKVNTSIEKQIDIQDNQVIFYTNIMNAIAELTELAKNNPEFDCSGILNAIKDVAVKVDTLNANQKAYYENIMQAIADVSDKVETGNAEQKEFYKGVMQGIVQLTEQVDTLGVDFAKAIAQLTGLLRDDITLDKENQELIRKLFSSIAALGGSNDGNTVLLGLLKEILDGVNTSVKNTKDIKDEQAKYYTSIMDAINNLTSLMAKYPNNDDFSALMKLVTDLSGKVDKMDANQKAYYTNLMQSIANVAAKVDAGNAEQKVFYENVMKAIAELSGKVDSATGDMKAYYEKLMQAIANASGKIDKVDANQKANYEKLMQAIMNLAGKVDKVDANQKAYYKAQADAIAKLSNKLDALGNTANKILEVVNGIAKGLPVDMAKIQSALAELKAMVKAQGNKIDNIDANVAAAQTLLLGIAASNEELKEWAVKIYNKIPPACQHKDCDCNAQLTIIIEKLEELSQKPNDESIKGSLEDILG